MYQKIIFLDIDGVLNSTQWYENTKAKSGNLDRHTIELLNLFDEKEVAVVISSSWGESAKRPLIEMGLTLPIIGTTEPLFNDYICRGNEVARWIYEKYKQYNKFNGDAPIDYVIFDDDTDFLLCQSDRFIKIDRNVGLQLSDIVKAKTILYK